METVAEMRPMTYNTNGSSNHDDGDQTAKDIHRRVPEVDLEVVGNQGAEVVSLCGLTGCSDDIDALDVVVVVVVVAG